MKESELCKDMPSHYAACLHADCPCAASCLHQLVYQPLMEKEAVFCLISPLRCSKNQSCVYYRNAEPVRYAFGFKGMKEKMYPAQYRKFMSVLTAYFGYNPYFDRKKGKRALPPKEQEFILQTLKKLGIEEPLEFDRYENRVNWKD